MLTFDAITKRNDFYISTPSEEYILNLTNVDIVNIVSTTTKKHTLTLKINEFNDKKVLELIENLSQETVINNNNKWFRNNLEYQDIIDNYQPCFNAQDNFVDVVLHTDYFVKLDGFKDIDSLLEKNDSIINITIKLIGIYIKNNSFYLRWLVKNIEKIDNTCDLNSIDELFEEKYIRLQEIIKKKDNFLQNEKKKLKEIYDTKDFDALTKSFYLILDKI